MATAAATLKNKLPEEAIQRLQIADSVVTAVGDKPEVTTAIVSQPGIKTMRDVAKLSVDKLTVLIAPNAKPDTEEYKQAKASAMAINGQSFAKRS